MMDLEAGAFCFLPVIGEEVVVIKETQCSEMANISNMN